MKIFSLFILFFILISCNSEQSQKDSESASAEIDQEESIEVYENQKTTFHLNLEEMVKNEKEVFLSELSTSIKYVPLETTLKYMIGEKTVKVKPCEEYIFVSEHGKPIGVFDLDGNFLRTIGNIGKGPGEYNFDYAWWPEGEARRVFIANTNIKGITTYSFEGEYLGDIITEPNPMSFAPLGESKFISWHFMQHEYRDSLFRLFLHDVEGIIFKRVFEAKKDYNFSRGISIMSPHFTYSPDGVLYNSWEKNLIMRGTNDGTFDTVLTWDYGKYQVPFRIPDDYDRFKREQNKYMYDLNACESAEKFYIKFHHGRNLKLAYLDKYSEEFTLIMNPDTSQSGVYNDIDGGPSFWPFWYSDRGKRFFKLIQAIDLLDASDLNPNGEIKNHQAARELTDIIAKLDEYSNPVLMIVELK